MDHQRLAFHLIQLFQSRRDDGIGGFTVVIHHQHWQIALMPHSIRAFMFAGMLRIEVPSCRFRRRRFTFF